MDAQHASQVAQVTAIVSGATGLAHAVGRVAIAFFRRGRGLDDVHGALDELRHEMHELRGAVLDVFAGGRDRHEQLKQELKEVRDAIQRIEVSLARALGRHGEG